MEVFLFLVTALLGSYESLFQAQSWCLQVTFWGDCEISWWSQCWALVERSKSQRCKSTSTTAVPGSRRNDSVDSTDTCSFWLWQRWDLRRQRVMTVFVVWLLWSYFHFEVNKNSTVTVTKKGGFLWSSVFPPPPLPQMFVCIFSRNTTFVPAVSQLNECFPPWGITIDVFQLQFMFYVPCCPCWITMLWKTVCIIYV